METNANTEQPSMTKGEVSMNEYHGLAQRVDSMESSIGLVLTKVRKETFFSLRLFLA